MSGIVNKIKDVLHSDSGSNSATHPHSHGTPEGTHGPHSSRIANAADPRVDSDRDGSHHVGTGRTAGHGEYGSANPLSGTSGTHGTYGAGTGMTGTHGTSEGAYGPHSSRLANAADPRVDSDRDGSHNLGGGMHNTAGTHYGAGTGMTGTGMIGTGMTGTHGTSEGTYGPHSSRLANAADPRVDSDRDGSHNLGGGMHNTAGTHYGAGTGMTGTHGTSEGAYGPHSSRLANAADPRVDSDRDGRGAYHHSGPGPAHNTAGPHSSDMANKLDPRVDSDLDGSKTLGGNKTYQ